MKEPLVSVVVPAYNAQRFLERTLYSALAQTLTDLELLLIDDGSTDGTRAIAERIASVDERVRVISVPNGGVANARNIGIQESAGAFVAFLDADDLWHPETIGRQAAALNGRGSDAAAAYAFSRIIDVDDRTIQDANAMACGGNVFARLLYAKFIGNGSSLLVRRETAVAVGGFEPSWAAHGIGGCEDLDFQLKVAARHPLAMIPQFLVGYRSYPGNMSGDKTRMARALVATVEHHIRINPRLPRWAAAKARGSTREYALSLLLRDRRARMACAEFAALSRCDSGRAAALAATLVTRKVRGLGLQREALLPNTHPPFPSLDPVARLRSSECPSPRDARNMQQLAELDAALGAATAPEEAWSVSSA